MTDQVNEAVQYRKKPVVIEAMQLAADPSHEFNDALHAFMAGCDWCSDRDGIQIETLEGTMHASSGDWIIKGVKGEFYPCKPDIFAATYEPATHPSRGVVDEVMVERAMDADAEEYGASIPASRVRRILEAAALPVVPSDEWKDRLATALDDLANPTGWIYFANGRVIGSRQFYIHVVHGDALPVRFADPAHQPAVPSAPEGRYRLAISKGEVQALIDYHDWCQSEADSMGAETTGDMQRIAELKAMLAATPKDQPAQTDDRCSGCGRHSCNGECMHGD